jgi:hypothetical protein
LVIVALETSQPGGTGEERAAEVDLPFRFESEK